MDTKRPAHQTLSLEIKTLLPSLTQRDLCQSQDETQEESEVATANQVATSW